jgi:uncharacterized membrane protein
MISQGGAGLIAQVYPVGILLIALETARVAQKRPVLKVRSPAWLGLRILSTAWAVILGMYSVVLCISAVSQDRGLDPQESIVVAVGGFAIFFCALLLIADSLIAVYETWVDAGGYDWRLSKRGLRAEQTPLGANAAESPDEP